eukprot:g30810.t1
MTPKKTLLAVGQAFKQNRNIVLVEIQKPDMKFEYPDEDTGPSVALRHVLTKIALPFSPHKASSIRDVEIKAILQRCEPTGRSDAFHRAFTARRAPAARWSAPRGVLSGRGSGIREHGAEDFDLSASRAARPNRAPLIGRHGCPIAARGAQNWGDHRTMTMLAKMTPQVHQQEIDRWREEPKIVNMRLSNLAKTTQWRQSLEVLRVMQQHAVQMNIFHLSNVINACAKGGQWHSASRLLEEMLRRKVQPDTICYNAAITACRGGIPRRDSADRAPRRGGTREALVEFAAAQASTRPSACAAERSAGTGRSSCWTSWAMPGFSATRSALTVASLLVTRRMNGKWPSHSSLKVALALLRSAPPVDAGVATVWRVCWNAAIDAAEKAQQWQVALHLLHCMPLEHHLLPDTISFNSAISACDKASCWQEALLLLHAATDRDAITFNASISACAIHEQQPRHPKAAGFDSGFAPRVWTPPLMWIWSQSEDEDEPAWLSFVIARYLDEEWLEQPVHQEIGQAVAKLYRESRDEGDDDLIAVLAKLSFGLKEMWKSAGFAEAFEGPVEVANRVPEPRSCGMTEGMVTIHGQKLSGEELLPVYLNSASTVAELCDIFQQQLETETSKPSRLSLALEGQALRMGDTLTEANLKDGDLVHLILRPDAWILRQVDLDSGRLVRISDGASWEGHSLLLRTEEDFAAPGWDICPNLEHDFAVEATVKLDEWPGPDYQGSIISQHGHGTGWELRCGGPGVNCVFTTTDGGHNEHMLPLSLGRVSPQRGGWKRKVGFWHHLCMVYDAGRHTLTLFADGVAGEPKPIRGTFVPYKLGFTEIGRNPEWTDRGVVGRIRNASVWPRGLDVEDMQQRAAEQIAEAEAEGATLEGTATEAASFESGGARRLRGREALAA